MDAAGLLACAQKFKARVIQLGDNLPAHRMAPPERADLRAKAQAADVRCELGARGLTDEHLQTYLGLCREFDCRILRFVADADGWEPTPAELTAILKNAVPALSSVKVTLALENHDRLPARTLRQIIDDVGSAQVGLCLDTANSLGAGEGLEQVAELLVPVTVNVHVKDVTIRRLPHLMGFVVEGCPLGHGRLPIRAFLDQLRARDYRGSVILESWSPPGETDAATVARELASVEASITTLQGWLRTCTESRL